MNRRFQLRIIHLFPGFRLELLAGIGPEIAVVEIEQQLHPCAFARFASARVVARSLFPPP
jgi:hypothetical protein